MLHKLGSDANSIAISYWQNEFCFLLDFDTHDLGLSNNIVRPMKLRSVFNKVFQVNH